MTSSRVSFILLAFAWCAPALVAQPSGGPYGPVTRTYALPTGAGTIYYVAVDGIATETGDLLAKPTTLESALERVKTGDAIVMRGGTYRTGNLLVNQGITIQPYADEHPVMKGTLVADSWQSLGNGLWVTKWAHLFPQKPQDWWQRDKEGKKTPMHLFNNDMVFVDGKFLQAVGWEGDVNEKSYYIDYEAGKVFIGIDPAQHLVEITAHDVALLRTTRESHGKPSDHKGYTMRGITLTQYAYRALEVEGTEPEGISEESQHGKEVVGTVLENCTISFCSRVAGYFRGDRLKMLHCKISDTSTEGVYIIASNDVLLEGNIFTRNNIERITGYYPAAVKIFNQSYRVTCRDNLVIDLPYSNGIWYDVGNVDGVFVNNWIEGVGHTEAPVPTNQLWPSDNGFFFEISKGAICAGNVFVNCDHGIMVLNSANVRVYNNTLVNSVACFGRNARVAAGDHFGWHASTGPDVDKRDGHVFVNNLLYGKADFARPLMFVWQPATLCEKLPLPLLKTFDNDVFVRADDQSAAPLVLWSPAQNEKCQVGYALLADLNTTYPAFVVNSKYYPACTVSPFASAELGNFHIVKNFPGTVVGISPPAEVSRLIKTGSGSPRYVGAYPPAE
jgi:parallel beta-helix repeat protein